MNVSLRLPTVELKPEHESQQSQSHHIDKFRINAPFLTAIIYSGTTDNTTHARPASRCESVLRVFVILGGDHIQTHIEAIFPGLPPFLFLRFYNVSGDLILREGLFVSFRHVVNDGI